VPDAAVSIGPALRALAVYLLVFQHVPVERCRQLIADATGAAVSAGFIHSCLATAAEALASVVKLIKTLLTAAAVAGFDETTLRVGPAGQKKYVLGAFTELYSLFFLGKRNLESFRDFGILPDFAGIVVSDRYACYFHDGWEHLAGHQACLAHILRDYQDAAESWPDAIWPAQAQRALRGLIRAWHDARDAGKTEIPEHVRGPLAREFRHAVLAGLSGRPGDAGQAGQPGIPGPRNAAAQHPGRDLLEFCRDRQDDMLRFCYDTKVWPTNKHQRARRAPAEDPAEDIRTAHQRRGHPGPARHPLLHRHRPQARPGRPHRAAHRHGRRPLEPASSSLPLAPHPDKITITQRPRDGRLLRDVSQLTNGRNFRDTPH